MEVHTVFTCEHAGNDLPEALKDIFQHASETLQSHRGWDPGAWRMALFLATGLNAPLFATFTSRLVIETNRSLNHPQLFSDFTRALPEEQKEKLLRDYYLPYRNKVETAILNSEKPVCHLSIHSFTPVWNGEIRSVDIGLLFDPARKKESEFCQNLQTILQQHAPELIVRMNEPYQGIDDGFTTYLRGKFQDQDYLGIEIEVNQKFEQTERNIVEKKILSALKQINSRID